MLKPYIITTTTQKVLSLLIKFSDQEFYEREIVRMLDISSGSANRSLNELFLSGVIKRRKEGKMFFYSIDESSTAVREVKKIINLLLIEPLVEELKPMASRIIMYGSCAQGTDTSESDLDLFIVSNRKQDISDIIFNFRFPPGYETIRIEPVVKTPVELLESGEAERTFLVEVESGIELWSKMANGSRV